MFSTVTIHDLAGDVVAGTVRISAAAHGVGTRVDVAVSVGRSTQVSDVTMRLDTRVRRVIEHGFQSWSTVRRCEPGDIRVSRREAPRWFRAQMLADRDSAGQDISGDSFLIHDAGVIGWLTNQVSFTRVRVNADGTVDAVWLLDGIEVSDTAVLDLDPLWVADGDPGVLYSIYATLAGEAAGALAARPTPAVWCSWYQYFADVTPDDVRENIALARDLGVEVIQIDDGWQFEIGRWDRSSARWSDHLAGVIDDIRAAGARAGIWTAPFLAIEGGTIASEHPEWLVRNDEGRPTTALFHAGWGGRVFALDSSRPDVLAHLEATYRDLRLAGVDYFKIDFCHAGAAVGRRHDQSRTRAGVLRAGLDAVRRGVGDDAFLVACGCPLLAAVGVVDAMRVSEDVAPFWDPRLYFDGFDESSVAARNAVEATLLRAPLHERWFTLDPDCVLLRSTDNELSASERTVVAASALASSGFIVLSDRLALYGPDEHDLARELFSQRDLGPRDIVDPFAEAITIRCRERLYSINWTSRPPWSREVST